MREQRSVATLERERLSLEERVRHVQAAISDSRQAMRDALMGVVDAAMLELHIQSTRTQSQEQARLAADLAVLHMHLSSARRSLTDAARARRAIELMRARHDRRWHDLIARSHADALEELAMRPRVHGDVGSGLL